MSGPFYFAWVNPGTAFDPNLHDVEDEQVFSLTIEQSEGDFASLEVEIRNPRVGLLSTTRKTWAWLSWNNGSDIKPLFLGRLVGIPTSINQEIVTLVFTARPIDYVAQKTSLAQSLKVFPFYDPIWVAADKLSDPDTVLEAYSALWHIDRVTHQLTVSDILVGEDGPVEEFLQSEVPYDSVCISIGTPPLRSVRVTGQVHWTQTHTGIVDIGSNSFSTYTGASLLSGWPKPGAGLGNGWSVKDSSAVDLYGVNDVLNASFSSSWSNAAKTHENGDTMSSSVSQSTPVFSGPFLSCVLTQKVQTGVLDPGDTLSEVFGNSEPINIGSSLSSTTFYVPLWQINTTLSLQYEAARQRIEVAAFTLATNVQALVTLPGEDESLTLNVSSVDVGLEIPGYGTPIESLSHCAYFPSARGRQSLEYLIALARSHLLLRSRAIEVTFACRFERAVDVSCRTNALLHDNRLPGHQAVGKIIKYSLSVNGDSGELIGSVTIGCSIGYGGAVAPVAGTFDYVQEGYVETGYQTYIGSITVLPSGDVGYSVPIDGMTDDGLVFPLTKRQVVLVEATHGSAAAQAAAIEASFAADVLAQQLSESPNQSIEVQKRAAQLNKSSTAEVMKANPVSYELLLKPVTGGPFQVEYDINVSDLQVPKMIDLEAAG